MPAPHEPGSWRAVEIGPGGIPAERIAPRGPGAPPSAKPSVTAGAPWGAGRSASMPLGNAPASGDLLWQKWAGPQEPDQPQPWYRRPLTFKIVGVLAVFGAVIALAVWANTNRPLNAAGRVSQITVGDCLEASGSRISGEVACDDAGADFAVVGRYPDTADASNCTATPSDVAVVAAGPAVLCLDYIAVVGDCLLAGDRATEVGKVDCSSDEPGIYRVEAVLHNTIDPGDCPKTSQPPLVHRFNSEVLCLGPA